MKMFTDIFTFISTGCLNKQKTKRTIFRENSKNEQDLYRDV